LWTAVSGSLTELNTLQNEIHIELANNGFVLEDRKFKPHITLASRPKLADLDLSVVQAKNLGEFMVEEVVLYESRAIHGKSTYIDLHRFSLELSDR
jgi:2'-5' RNA ligase